MIADENMSIICIPVHELHGGSFFKSNNILMKTTNYCVTDYLCLAKGRTSGDP